MACYEPLCPPSFTSTFSGSQQAWRSATPYATSAQVGIHGGHYPHYSNSKTKTWNHVVGLVVSCDCCIGVQLHYMQKIHSDLWLYVKEELSSVNPWWNGAYSWGLLTAWHNCVVSLQCFICIEKVHTCCSEWNISAVFSLPLHWFSWHLLSEHSFSLHKKPQARWGCAVVSRTTLSHQLVWSRELSAPSASPAPWTDAVSCPLLQVTMSPVPGSPKVHLKFLAGGLGGPRSRPSAPSSSSPSCLPSADLPCPSASALSSRPCGIIPAVPSPGEGPSAAALVSRVTVRGKKKILLWWLAFVKGSNQYLGHPAEVRWKTMLTLHALTSRRLPSSPHSTLSCPRFQPGGPLLCLLKQIMPVLPYFLVLAWRTSLEVGFLLEFILALSSSAWKVVWG